MGEFGLVDRYRHGQESYSPSGQDSAHQDHGQTLCSRLQDRTNETDQSSKLDGGFPAKAVHRQSALQGADHRCGYQVN